MKIESIFKALIVYFRLICFINGLDLPNNICEGKHNVFIPHPDLCTKFIYCYLETPFIANCEYPTEVFHNGECVVGNPNTCEIFTTTTSTVTTTTPLTPQTTTSSSISTPPITVITTTEIGITTENLTETTQSENSETTTQSENSETTTQSESTTISHEISSGTSTTTRFATPPLTIFTRTTTTSVPEITTTQRPTGPPEICDGYDFMFASDPNYCYRFYFCMFGVAYPYECAPDKIFSEQLQKCIDGYWDTCEPKTTATVPEPTTEEKQQHKPC